MQLYHNPHYTNIGPRLLAAIIDGIIPLLLSLPALISLAGSPTISALITQTLTTLAQIWLPLSLFYGLILVLLLHVTGYTPGKWLLGIKITDSKQQRLPFLTLLIREWMAKRVSGSLFLLGYLAIPFDSNHQGWHDQLIGSFALKTKTNLLPGLLVFVILLSLEIYLLSRVITTIINNSGLIRDIVFIFEPLVSLFNR